ncbi:MAG: hypothetical protein EON86_02490 [Brevundimonas sp.]|nr:MAG: hypothetical protein EON86_02490 [Brevundimonas sp.]
MSLRLALAASALLAVATPVFAQQAPVAPPAPPAAPAAPAPTPEQTALMTRMQAAGEALEAAMEELEPQAEEIRDDAALSDADKETRIRALIAGHQPVIDEFTTSLQAVIMMRAAADGTSPEEAAQGAAMIAGMVSGQIAQSLITGEDPDGETGAGE